MFFVLFCFVVFSGFVLLFLVVLFLCHCIIFSFGFYHLAQGAVALALVIVITHVKKIKENKGYDFASA
jgi:hypothetical protein